MYLYLVSIVFMMCILGQVVKQKFQRGAHDFIERKNLYAIRYFFMTSQDKCQPLNNFTRCEHFQIKAIIIQGLWSGARCDIPP